jgi:tRNA(Ile)-lysidine synthase
LIHCGFESHLPHQIFCNDMIKLNQKLPEQLGIAVSGGVDSMAALDFVRRKHTVTAYFFDHDTPTSKAGLKVVRHYCDNSGIPVKVGTYTRDKNPKESLEEYWRDQRYAWLNQQPDKIITAHHLDDCVETWIWGSLNGNPRLPKAQIKNIIRPFLATTKQDLVDWCKKNSILYYEDATNTDTRFTRNYIRYELMPHALKVNPGLAKVVKKKLVKEYRSYSSIG